MKRMAVLGSLCFLLPFSLVAFPRDCSGGSAERGECHWSRSGSSIYYNDGNVGIGTAEPGSALEISSGSLRVNEGSIRVDSYHPLDGGVLVQGKHGYSYYGWIDSDLVNAYSANIELAGDSTAARGLNINIDIEDGEDASPKKVTGVAASIGSVGGPGSEGVGFEHEVWCGSTGGDQYGFFANADFSSPLLDNFYAFYAVGGRLNVTGSKWGVYIEDLGSYFGGSVGIGTADPAYALDVAGDINFTGDLCRDGVPLPCGVGDGHSLDAADGDPEDAVYVDESGSVSIGWEAAGGAESLNVNGAVRIGNTVRRNAGTIRWTGRDFEGYDGKRWRSLTRCGAEQALEIEGLTRRLAECMDEIASLKRTPEP